jgi:hypothetical protein
MNSVDDDENFRNAEEFSKRMEADKLAKKQKVSEKRKKLKERIKLQEQDMLKKQKEIDESKEQERQERLQKIKDKDDQRKKGIEDNQKIYKQNLKTIQKPLYKKIEKEYEKQYVMPELEKRKKELADKRNFLKPIKREELDEHDKKYQEILKKREVDRHHELKDDNNYDPSKYKSKFLDEILDNEQKSKLEEKRKAEEVGEMAMRKQNYAKLVQETHKPTVSKRKEMEMDLIKQNLAKPTAFERMKKRMVSSSHGRVGQYKNLNSSMDNSVAALPSNKRRKAKDFDWREKNRFVDVPKPPKDFVKIDYLHELKSRKSKNDISLQHKSLNWDIEINKYDGEDRIYHMKEKARMLEEQAMKKERLMNANHDDTTYDRAEVNDLIIDSIKAKIALLDNIE